MPKIALTAIDLRRLYPTLGGAHCGILRVKTLSWKF